MTEINHTVLDMETIGDYQPIAGLGRNTIRKLTSKYADLSIGDIVEMQYVDGFDPEVCNGIERLQVASLAALTLDTILNSEHFDMNHGDFDTPEQMEAFFAEVYPDTADDALFLVIYFQ